MEEKLNYDSDVYRYVDNTLADLASQNPTWKPIVDEWLTDKAYDDMSKSDVLCFVYLHFPRIMECLGRMEFIEGLEEVAGRKALVDSGIYINPKGDRLVDKSYVVNTSDHPLRINHPNGLEIDYYGQCLVTAKEGIVHAHDLCHVRNERNAAVTLDGRSFESGPHIADPVERSRMEVMRQFEEYPQFWRPLLTGPLWGSEVTYDRQRDSLVWQSKESVDIVSLPYDHTMSLEKNMEKLETLVLDTRENHIMDLSKEKTMSRGR